MELKTTLILTIGAVLALVVGIFIIGALISHFWFLIKPRPVYDWNPLRKYPRNRVCFCGSGKKFKNCHVWKLKQALPQEEAELMRELMEEMGIKT